MSYNETSHPTEDKDLEKRVARTRILEAVNMVDGRDITESDFQRFVAGTVKLINEYKMSIIGHLRTAEKMDLEKQYRCQVLYLQL